MNILNILPKIWPHGLLIDCLQEVFRKDAPKPEPVDSKKVQGIKPVYWARFQKRFTGNLGRIIDIKS